MDPITIPYILPLFLGMTFDAQNFKPGVDIFDLDKAKHPHVEPFPGTLISYKVTTSKTEAVNALGISGELALKLKTSNLDIGGKGSYLKSNDDYTNSVEILSTFHHSSEIRELKGDWKALPNWWNMYTPAVLGTHYVFSIKYGVEMIASAKFIAFNRSEVSNIKGAVQGALGTGGDQQKLEGNFEKLAKNLQGKASLEISFFGTGPLSSVVNTVEGFMDLVRNFKARIDEEGMSKGFPMSVQLFPLSDIAPPEEKEKFSFKKNKDLLKKITTFNQNLDDLRLARLALVSWTRTLPNTLEVKHEETIGKLLTNITDILNVFYATSSNLDVTKNESQLEPAFDAYYYDGETPYYRFTHEVGVLKEELGPKIKRGKVPSDTYIQWGKSLCTEKESDLLYDGFAISSSEEGIGGSAKYECAPKPEKTAVGYQLRDSETKSNIAGIRYANMERSSNPFKGGQARKISEQGVPCAKCFASKYGKVSMLPGATECPGDWIVMYSGFLMSSRIREGHTTEYICVDEYPSPPYKMEKQPYSINTMALTVVRTEGALPLDPYIDGDLIRCVVCAVRGNRGMY